MLLPTTTNLVCLALSIATVLVVAYDHKKWTQSNQRYTLMYIVWVPLLTIQCLTVLSIGGNNIAVNAVWLTIAALTTAGGYTYRHLRSTNRATGRRATTTQTLSRVAPRPRPTHM